MVDSHHSSYWLLLPSFLGCLLAICLFHTDWINSVLLIVELWDADSPCASESLPVGIAKTQRIAGKRIATTWYYPLQDGECLSFFFSGTFQENHGWYDTFESYPWSYIRSANLFFLRWETFSNAGSWFREWGIEVRQAMIGDESHHCWSFNLERLPPTMTMMFEVQDLKATRKGVCIYTYTYRIFIITHILRVYIYIIYTLGDFIRRQKGEVSKTGTVHRFFFGHRVAKMSEKWRWPLTSLLILRAMRYRLVWRSTIESWLWEDFWIS